MPPGSCDKNKSAKHTHQHTHTNTHRQPDTHRHTDRFNIRGVKHTHTHRQRSNGLQHTPAPRPQPRPLHAAVPVDTHIHRTHTRSNWAASLNIIHTIKPRAAAFARLDINFYRQHPFLAACVRTVQGGGVGGIGL